MSFVWWAATLRFSISPRSKINGIKDRTGIQRPFTLNFLVGQFRSKAVNVLQAKEVLGNVFRFWTRQNRGFYF